MLVFLMLRFLLRDYTVSKVVPSSRGACGSCFARSVATRRNEIYGPPFERVAEGERRWRLALSQLIHLLFDLIDLKEVVG